MLSRLKQFDIRCQILTGLNGLRFAQHEVSVDKTVQGRLLTGVFTVAQSLFDPFYLPGHFLVKKRLAIVPFYKTDLHFGWKMVVDNGPVHFFQIFSHTFPLSNEFSHPIIRNPG